MTTSSNDLPYPAQASARPSSDDRIWAASAHASAILVMWGAIVPAIIWAWQGRRSAYVAFQAAQALAYQLLQAVYMWLVGMGIAAVMIGLMVLLAFQSPDEVTGIFILEMAAMICIFGAMGLYIILGLGAAAACLAGRGFIYPLLGHWILNYLKPAALSEDPA